MKRIQASSKSILCTAITKLLMTGSSTPFFIEIVFLVMEALLYTYLVSSQVINTHITWSIFGPTSLIVVLAGSLLLRYLFNATIIRLIYVPCALSALTFPGLMQVRVVVWCLILSNLIIDVLSRIQFEYVSQNPYSETANEIKIAHYIIIIISMVLKFQLCDLFAQNMRWIGELINLALFIFLAVVKQQSTMRNKTVKQLIMRFYLLSIGYYARNLILNWNNTIGTTHQHLLVIGCSQIIYSIGKHKYAKIQADTQISNGNIVYLVFSILSYFYNQTIKQLSADRSSSPSSISPTYLFNNFVPHFKKGSIWESITQNDSHVQKISLKMEHLLKSACEDKCDNYFRCVFLLVQIKFNTFNNIVVAKKMLINLKQQCSCFSWINKLCIYKFEQKLHKQIQNNYQINQLCHFDDFLQNQKLRTMIVKHSYDYLTLWKYMNKSNFLFKKLTKLFNKVIEREQQINKMFNVTEVKCNSVILLFIDYLYMVRRDVHKALKTCRSFEIYEQSHYELKVEDKIYMCVSLQQNNMLIIQNVSYNIKRLLGYERSTVKNANVGVVLPTFFSQAHQKLVYRVIYENNGNYYVMKKSVIVKHFDGYYLPAIIEFKMVYNAEGGLTMEGYLEVMHNNLYNWPNYFFVKHDEGELIQIGPSLKGLIQLTPRKFVHINQYFQSKSEQSQFKIKNQNEVAIQQRKFLYTNGIQYQYVRMRSIFSDEVNYSYYVCKNNLFDMPSELNVAGIPQKFQQYLSQFLKFQKYSLKYQDFQTNLQQYFSDKTKLINHFQQKGPLIVFGVILILFVGMFIMQSILIERISVIKQNNDKIKQDMGNLIQFYHSLQNMGAIVNSFTLYSKTQRFFIYDYYQIPELCLTLSKMNEKLVKFDINEYGQQKGSVDNSAKPLRQLISDFVANFYMNLYVPDFQIMTMSKSAVHTYSKYIFGEGLDDYLAVFKDQIIQFKNLDERIKISLNVSICVFIIIVYILIYKLDAYEREYEYQAMNTISNINAKPIFINSISEFIRRAAGGVNQTEATATEKQARVKHSNNTTMISNANSKIQMSENMSARQNSVRGFFQEEVLSSTNREHRNLKQINNTIPLNTLEMKQKVQQDQSARKQLKMRPRSKKFIVSWTLLVGAIIAIALIGTISDQTVNKIQLPKSMINLSTILNKQILFSSMINSYLQNLVNRDRQELFDLNNQKYQSLQNVQTIFEETSSLEFSNFTDMLQKMTYSYICEYNQCNSTYKDYINIIYFSVIHKLNQFMVNNPNVDFSTPEGSFSVSALFYSHYLLQSIIYKLLKSYLSDYTLFQYKKLIIYYALSISQISALLICLIVSCYLYIKHFRNERTKCIVILDLVKQQSYMIKQSNNDL